MIARMFGKRANDCEALVDGIEMPEDVLVLLTPADIVEEKAKVTR
jgi:hypothetical protein